MRHATVSVDALGRVLIPAPIRQELAFRPGTQLVAYVEDGRLILEERARMAATSALLAYLCGEPGQESVPSLLHEAHMSAVTGRRPCRESPSTADIWTVRVRC